MQASIILTVAQSKRLIARGVAALPVVGEALKYGTVVIGRGTTNGYLAEEILGCQIAKREYVAGRTLPPGTPWEAFGNMTYPDIVLQEGRQVEGATVTGAVETMGPRDVFIKGGNALNYLTQEVGVLVGHPAGGTLGIYGALVSKKIPLIIPIGLEKLVYEDIGELSRASRAAVNSHPDAPVTSLMPMTGTIITEIEAWQVLCGVQARLLAAGGVAGAEGGLWLLLEGDDAAIEHALALHASLTDEPPMCLP